MAQSRPVPRFSHEDWMACVRNRDAGTLERMLQSGADPNAPIPPPGRDGTTTTPLSAVVGNIPGLPQLRDAEPLIAALLAAGARIVPDEPIPSSVYVHPLAHALATSCQPAVERLLGALSTADRAAMALPIHDAANNPRVLTLLDVAVNGGRGEAAMRLWDKFGLAPHPADTCPHSGRPRFSTLTLATRWAATESMAPVMKRLLALDWPQDDLDAALSNTAIFLGPGQSQALPPIVDRLLAMGANPGATSACGATALEKALSERVRSGSLAAPAAWMDTIRRLAQATMETNPGAQAPIRVVLGRLPPGDPAAPLITHALAWASADRLERALPLAPARPAPRL